MSVEITIEVKELEKIQRKTERMVQQLRGEAMFEGMKNATLVVQRHAKLNLQPWRGPGTGGVFTGRMRASILPDVRKERDGFVGVVGSNVSYAKYQELGFKPHWVSVKNIGVWAQRVLGVRKPVFVTGTPLRFLARAVDEHTEDIFREIGDAVSKIVKK